MAKLSAWSWGAWVVQVGRLALGVTGGWHLADSQSIGGVTEAEGRALGLALTEWPGK